MQVVNSTKQKFRPLKNWAKATKNLIVKVDNRDFWIVNSEHLPQPREGMVQAINLATGEQHGLSENVAISGVACYFFIYEDRINLYSIYSFDELNFGDTFLYEGSRWMKIRSEVYGDDFCATGEYTSQAIKLSLSSPEVRWFVGDEMVDVVDNEQMQVDY
jgi:hypothetical protein